MSSSDPLVDKLTIETPEQTALEFPLAGIGSRFLALALDTLIQFAALLLLLFVVVALTLLSGQEAFWQGGRTWALAVAILLWFALYYGYFAVFEAVWNGQTPGKRFTRLRVIQESGRPINVYQAMARNLLRIVDQLPGIYGVAIVACLLNRQNKRLGDYVAGTVVVHEKPLAESRPQWEAPQNPSAARFNAVRLAAEDLQLIEAFLERRGHLASEVRAQMALRIADRAAQKLSIPLEERRAPALPGGDEAFLELLAQERRNAAGYR